MNTIQRYLYILTFVPVLERGHDKESNSLVGALFKDGGSKTLVCPS